MSVQLPGVLQIHPLICTTLQLRHGDRFINPVENPTCPVGGCRYGQPCKTRGVGKQMASANVDLTALEGSNAMADQIARVA